jgi:hypothetical protein
LITLKAHPALKILLVRAFRSLTHNGTCDFTDDELSNDERTVVDAQAAIGWNHFLFGRLAAAWTSMQTQHAIAEKLDRGKFSGSDWTAKIIKHLWRALLAHWQVRNKALHGETYQENAFTKRARLQPLIRNLYERQHELPAFDRVMFRKPLEARLQQPLSVLTTWLSVVTPAFQAARIDADSDDDEQSNGTPDTLSDDENITDEQYPNEDPGHPLDDPVTTIGQPLVADPDE